jgi:hypothetical protein
MRGNLSSTTEEGNPGSITEKGGVIKDPGFHHRGGEPRFHHKKGGHEGTQVPPPRRGVTREPRFHHREGGVMREPKRVVNFGL